MEILVFGMIAACDGYRQQQETFFRESDEFQPFDVRTLAHLFNVKNDSSKEPTDSTPLLMAQVPS